MKNNRVKHFSENGYEVLTTSCKKVKTAVSRFDDFLSNYDSYIRETVLKAFMNVEIVGYLSGGDIAFHGVAFSDDCRVDVFFTDLSEEYRVEISFTSDTTEDTKDTTEDTKDTTEDTKDTTEDTKDTTEDTKGTTEDTSDTSDTITIILGALDSVQVKRSIVKPVSFSSSFLEVRTGGEYPFIVVLPDGSKMWDCRQRFYNTYLCELLGAPPDSELPF